MNATMTVPSNNPAAAPTAAGELSYLKRPIFFRDQLLTDQDLRAMTAWTQGKFDLRRLLHGWGIVCGLSVYCDPAGKSPGTVFISPGYALDATGQDIVVAEEASLDLSTTCLSQGGRCAPPANPSGQGAATLFDVPAAQISAYDLYISYAEAGADARHVPRRGACKDTSGCEYARQIEKYNLTVRQVAPAAAAPATPTDPNKAWPEYEKWRADATGLVADVKGLVPGGDATKLTQLQARLSSWTTAGNYPPYQFGFLTDRIAALNKDTAEAEVAWLVYALLQDGRARLLNCACTAIPTDTSVLLARVWLWAKQDDQGRLSCQVIGIDSRPPHRRPLGLEPCWRTPQRQVNLGAWIGAQLETPDFDLNKTLAEWDLTAPNPTPVTLSFGDPKNFGDFIGALMIVARRTNFSAVKYLDMGPPLGKRIAAFLI